MPFQRSDVQPPNEPWLPLKTADPPLGYLSFYYSEGLSPLAVREITRPHDNKSDPNLETATYGLFSTCQRQMRSSIVKHGVRYIFLVARRNGRRVVSGYYRLAWYAEGILHAQRVDYALAADKIHFIDPPVPLAELPDPVNSAASKSFRLSKALSASETKALVDFLDCKPNALPHYLSEIDRLERFQQYYSGYRYVSWKQEEPFTWEFAEQYLMIDEQDSEAGMVNNTSVTGFWECDGCGQFVDNAALLKRCPHCGTMGSLAPVNEIRKVC